MKKIALTVLLLILLPNNIYSTPPGYTSVQSIFLGYDARHYYVLQIERVNKGNYYIEIDYVSFIKFKNNGEMAKKYLLREISHSTIDEPVQSHVKKGKLDIEEYLLKNKAAYAFPSRFPGEHSVYFEKEGMLIGKGNKKILLVGTTVLSEVMSNQVKTFHKDTLQHAEMIQNEDVVSYDNYIKNKPRVKFNVSGAFNGGEYIYIVVNYGSDFFCSHDGDYYQVVIPVKAGDYKKASMQIREMLK